MASTNGAGANVAPSARAMVFFPADGSAALVPISGFKRQYARAATIRSKRHKARPTVLAPPERTLANATPGSLTTGAGDVAPIRPALSPFETLYFAALKPAVARSSRGKAPSIRDAAPEVAVA